MAITYTWKIPRLEYYPHKNGFDRVVNCIHWILLGSDDEGHDSSVFGSQTLNTDDLNPDKYIAYADLTQDIVVTWLTDAMGDDNIKKMKDTVATQINNIINPPNVTADPPWAPGPTPPTGV